MGVQEPSVNHFFLKRCPPLLPTHLAVPGNGEGAVVSPGAEEITNVVINNLGGTGSYENVVSMAPGEINCPDKAAACVKKVSFGLVT